jgi:hypothetical protein
MLNYNASEHLAVEVILKFKERIIFRRYVPKNRQQSSIKICKLCSNSEYTYNMTVYYDKDAAITIGNLMATYSFARNLTHKIEGIRQSF